MACSFSDRACTFPLGFWVTRKGDFGNTYLYCRINTVQVAAGSVFSYVVYMYIQQDLAVPY